MLSRLGFKRSPRKPYLILGMDHRRPDFHHVYNQVKNHCDAELITLNKRQLRRFPELLKKIPLEQYQGVWFDIGFKYMHQATSEINRCQYAVFYEEDAVQDALDGSPWKNQFSEFYRKIERYTLFTTGISASQSLSQKGINSKISIKGYDPEQIFRDCRIEKKIPAGFIGSTNASVYRERKQLIEYLQAQNALTACEHVKYGKPYRQLLNRIQVFVSADIGLSEYMAKNFEAMACGCVLLAYRQNNGEEERLGLIHGENCFLYKDQYETLAILRMLESDQDLLNRVASAGRELAEAQFSFDRIAKDISDALTSKSQA